MLKVESICKRYGKQIILDDISFCANAGDCVGIIGTNGSGKTTLLSILSGISSHDSGNIYYNNEVVSDSSHSNQISYVPQENPLIEDLSVLDNLRLWYTDSILNLKEELNNGVLKMLGIDGFLHKKVSKLSGGMKKRLSIGIALANDPSLLIMDEPNNALDLACKLQINNYIKSFIQDKKIIILVTHDESEIALCNKLYLLKNHTLTKVNSRLKGAELIELLSTI